jgi:predicted DsbA family dithiol-disulfide isomerase
MKVEIYSDVACPWCYIGKRRFEKALAAFPQRSDVEVIYKPYQLDPAAPAKSAPVLERLQRKFGALAGSMMQRVTDTARDEGIEMNFDRALAANTLTAHRLLWLAEREYGSSVQQDLAEALFDAHFSQGGDIADHDPLTELAVSAGMDRARVADFLRSSEGTDEVKAEIRGAQEMGITAVPTFIFDDRYAVQGGQPSPIFLQALERAAADSVETGADRG